MSRSTSGVTGRRPLWYSWAILSTKESAKKPPGGPMSGPIAKGPSRAPASRKAWRIGIIGVKNREQSYEALLAVWIGHGPVPVLSRRSGRVGAGGPPSKRDSACVKEQMALAHRLLMSICLGNGLKSAVDDKASNGRMDAAINSRQRLRCSS